LSIPLICLVSCQIYVDLISASFIWTIDPIVIYSGRRAAFLCLIGKYLSVPFSWIGFPVFVEQVSLFNPFSGFWREESLAYLYPEVEIARHVQRMDWHPILDQ